MSETYLALVGGFFCIGMAFLALVAVIVLLVINQTRSRKMKKIDPNWTTAPGRVTATRVEESARTRVDEDTFYSPWIEFEYTVANQIYTGRQAVGRPSNLESMAKRMLLHYPPGTELVVYFKPERPQEARLLLK